ncbi:MAG: alpha/beta hydrolase [Mycobacterium sp.]
MELSVADIQRWDPEAVREVVRAATARGASCDEASRILAELPALTAWGGYAAAAAWDSIGLTRMCLETHAREALAVARAAARAAGDIETIKTALDALDDDVRAAGLEIDPLTGRVLPGPGFPGGAALPTLAVAQGRLDAILAAAVYVDAELAAAISLADGTLGFPRSGPTPTAGDPAATTAWWRSLTPGQQAAELRGNPAGIGNLNGVPVTARNEANLRVLRHDLDAVDRTAERAGVSAEEVVADAGRYGVSPAAVSRYRNAVRTAEGLRHNTGDRGANPVYLLAYDPLAFDAKGRAVIAIGNPDTARNTAVVVPGTSSSVRGGWLSDGHDDALHLFSQSQIADPGATAVVAWMGYDSPDDVRDLRIATPWLARTGAGMLAADVEGLAATHLGGGNHLTVIGHSYGSTTVADAAVVGMPATNVVLLGCPGTDLARSAADFHLAGGGGVYVGDASTDPVGWLGVSPAAGLVANAAIGNPLGPVAGLGADPAAESFGAKRFRSEVPGSDGLSVADHSHYYTIGSESLRAMTEISTGRGARLVTDGLLAQTRHVPDLRLPDTVSIPGFGVIDLPDVSIPVSGAPEVIDPEWERAGDTVHDNHGYR